MSALARVRAHYGAGPLHALSMAACLAISGFAALKIGSQSYAVGVGVWFVGSAVAHDFILFPLYTVIDRLTGARRRDRSAPSGWKNYVRAPAAISGLALVVYAPLILGFAGSTYEDITALPVSVYLGRWLLLTGLLFAVSGAVYAVRVGVAGLSR